MDGVKRDDEDHLEIDGKACRSFVVNGYPSLVSIGWLDDIYNFSGEMDTSLHIFPSDERNALNELNKKIIQYKAQLQMELEKGRETQITVLQDKIEKLTIQKQALEQNFENLFHIKIVSTLYEKNKIELDKTSTRFINKINGRRINVSSLYLKQDEGFLSSLPFGLDFLGGKLRNVNTGALTSCFPFYNSEISHKNGVFIGINNATSTPILLDFYDRDILNNGNISVFGQAGSGKSYFLSLLTLRSSLRGIRTVFIDPEGDYEFLTKNTGGNYIKISPDRNESIGMNPFDIEEEWDEELEEFIVDLKAKVSDNLNLIAIMVGGLTQDLKSIVASVLFQMYSEKGITEDPRSLKREEKSFDSLTGDVLHDLKKEMPTLSDFHRLLDSEGQRHNNQDIIRIANSLRLFTKGGLYDLFDRQTSKGLEKLFNKPIVCFDVSRLEENILRPIGMYIALTWTWEKFIKKDPTIKKRVICDEAWMLMSRNLQGSEFTAHFLENCARRIRKRNGGLVVASQNFMEFSDNPQGKAVLTNTLTNIFLGQSATDIDAVVDTFNLSGGEREFLLSARKGELLIKCKGDSSVAIVFPFNCEREILTKPKKI